MWCLKEADKIYNWPDFKEITIYTDDVGPLNTPSISKQNSYINLIPDFTFYGWPQVKIDDYDKTIQEIDLLGQVPYKINKVGWIGNLDTNIMRRRLFNLGNTNGDILDIINMSWTFSNIAITEVPSSHNNYTKYMSLSDLVSTYSILIDIEGVGYSARLKFLLWSHRPVIIVDRPHKEFFFEHLKEWEHYIPVKRNLSDLLEKTRWIMENYSKAQEIAENAYNFAKIYLTRESCYKQWNTVIRASIEDK
jgi:hypothetical protein